VIDAADADAEVQVGAGAVPGGRAVEDELADVHAVADSDSLRSWLTMAVDVLGAVVAVE
jgi:hypothetical protein